MKLTKQNVCVYIESKSKLQEAKELLEKYDEEITEDGTFRLTSKSENYLQLFVGDKKWCLLTKWRKQITLYELETILKNESK